MSVHAPADDFPELNLIMGFDDLDDAELFDADALVSSGDFDSSLSPGVANTHNTVEDFFVDNASSNRNMSQEILDKIASRKADLAVRRRKSRQRVKSSREALQRQAKELTDELARRKQAQKMRQIRAKLYRPATYFIWKHVAARELRERRQAEAELRSLTEAFEVQKAYIATLSGQARKWSSDHEVRNVKKLRNETEDDAFWNALSRDLEMDCSRVDEVFSECGMATLPESGATLRSIKKSGVGDEVEYYELVKKFPQSSSYLKTESIMWAMTDMKFFNKDHHERYDISKDPENTVAIKCCEMKTLKTGEQVSMSKRFLIRRFVQSDRIVSVWKHVSDGTNTFRGVCFNETGWCCTRPSSDPTSTGSVVEMCQRWTPMSYNTSESSKTTVGQFHDVLQDRDDEIFKDVMLSLEKLSVGNS